MQPTSFSYVQYNSHFVLHPNSVGQDPIAIASASPFSTTYGYLYQTHIGQFCLHQF